MLNYNLLMEEIKNIKNCYFIYSYDGKLVKNFTERLRDTLIYSDLRQFNYIHLKFDSNFKLEEFIEVCDTLPMMQERKIVVLEDCSFLRSDYDNKSLLSDLKKYLENFPKHCILIFYYVFKEADKNKDALKSFEPLGETCKILELKGDEFYSEVLKLFKNNDITIKPSTVSYFCDVVSHSFFTVENEINKLKLFVGNQEVTREIIDDIVSRSFENNVFLLINNILENNLKKSLVVLNELLMGGSDFNYILSIIVNQFSKFLDVKIMLDENMDINEIAKKLKMNKYVVNNFYKLSNRYSINSIINILDGLIELEYKLRTVKNVDGAFELEMFLVQMCNKI